MNASSPPGPLASSPPILTAALITLNEQENLPGLFDSLDWVDEIVVVDGGSTDATVDIARRRGARVYRRPFDTFARQRNHALALARGDWILSIDADERPTPALAAEIRARLPHCRQNAFRVLIRSSIFGRPMRFSGTQDDRPIRLVRRGHARWTGDVHEVVECSGRVGRLRAPLEHTTLPDLQAFLAKMGRYTTLEAAARVARGQPPTAAAAWLAPPREVFRRLFWKHGFLDGPEGWAFCLLSGLSAWVLAQRHRVYWDVERNSFRCIRTSSGDVPLLGDAAVGGIEKQCPLRLRRTFRPLTSDF